MSELTVSLVGTVAKEPQLRMVTAEDIAVCNFRVACTPRRLDRIKGEWVAGETMFFGVSCWRRLAEHVAGSLRLGDTAVIRGRLVKRSYLTAAGETRETYDIEATEIGVDLARGVARQQRPAREPAGGSVEAETEAGHQEPPEPEVDAA